MSANAHVELRKAVTLAQLNDIVQLLVGHAADIKNLETPEPAVTVPYTDVISVDVPVVMTMAENLEARIARQLIATDAADATAPSLSQTRPLVDDAIRITQKVISTWEKLLEIAQCNDDSAIQWYFETDLPVDDANHALEELREILNSLTDDQPSPAENESREPPEQTPVREHGGRSDHRTLKWHADIMLKDFSIACKKLDAFCHRVKKSEPEQTGAVEHELVALRQLLTQRLEAIHTLVDPTSGTAEIVK